MRMRREGEDEGEDVTLLSQKSNRKPAFDWKLAALLTRQSISKKKPEKTDASKLAPIFLRFLFQFASQTRRVSPADCRSVDLCA